jgi:hypothetical protein
MAGVSGWWVLDTGASDATIDRAVAARLGLGSIGTSMVTSMFGQDVAPIYRLDQLDLGPVSIERLAVIEMDLAPLSHATGETLVGIIGYDLLSHLVIDYSPGQAAVLVGPPAAAPANLPWQPLRILDRHPVVDGSVEGAVSGRFRLDTGAGPGLMLNRWVAHQTSLLRNRATEPIAGTPMEARIGTIRTLTLGAITTVDVQTLFVTGGDGPVAAVFNDRDLVGNVGVGVLSRYRLVLDYPGRRFAMVAP